MYKRFQITLVRPWPCNSQLTMEVVFDGCHTVESLTEWGTEFYPWRYKGWQLDSVMGPVRIWRSPTNV